MDGRDAWLRLLLLISTTERDEGDTSRQSDRQVGYTSRLRAHPTLSVPSLSRWPDHRRRFLLLNFVTKVTKQTLETCLAHPNGNEGAGDGGGAQ